MKLNEERQQGDCENCDFRKFSEKMVDILVDMMVELGVDNLEDFQKFIKEKEAST